MEEEKEQTQTTSVEEESLETPTPESAMPESSEENIDAESAEPVQDVQSTEAPASMSVENNLSEDESVQFEESDTNESEVPKLDETSEENTQTTE